MVRIQYKPLNNTITMKKLHNRLAVAIILSITTLVLLAKTQDNYELISASNVDNCEIWVNHTTNETIYINGDRNETAIESFNSIEQMEENINSYMEYCVHNHN